jgi:hypothetical protein
MLTVLLVWPWYDKVAWAGNLLLVLVGIVGIGVAVCTQKKIERQTKAGETAAEAALLNVKALITSERPWLLVSIEPIQRNAGMIRSLSDTADYEVRAVNRGNTPAELVEGHCSIELQPIPDFIPAANLHDPIFAPKDNLTVQDQSFLIRPVDTSMFSEKSMEGTNPKLWHAYGKLSYWDTFRDRSDQRNQPYVTQWSFTYDPFRKIFFRIAGPYPKNT